MTTTENGTESAFPKTCRSQGQIHCGLVTTRIHVFIRVRGKLLLGMGTHSEEKPEVKPLPASPSWTNGHKWLMVTEPVFVIVTVLTFLISFCKPHKEYQPQTCPHRTGLTILSDSGEPCASRKPRHPPSRGTDRGLAALNTVCSDMACVSLWRTADSTGHTQ